MDKNCKIIIFVLIYWQTWPNYFPSPYQVGEGISTISDAFPPLPTVDFDGTRLSIHSDNPGQQTNSKSDAVRGERNSDEQYNGQNNKLEKQ